MDERGNRVVLEHSTTGRLTAPPAGLEALERAVKDGGRHTGYQGWEAGLTPACPVDHGGDPVRPPTDAVRLAAGFYTHKRRMEVNI
jgi:hypothetical protein